jgi:chorismate mutase
MIRIVLINRIRDFGRIYPTGKKNRLIGKSKMSEIKIASLRKEVDVIDENLLQLIKKRLHLTKEIGEIKKENQMSIIDENREKALFKALEKKSRELKLDPDIIATIWHQILQASYRSQE